jgi:hypothetical protein
MVKFVLFNQLRGMKSTTPARRHQLTPDLLISQGSGVVKIECRASLDNETDSVLAASRAQ